MATTLAELCEFTTPESIPERVSCSEIFTHHPSSREVPGVDDDDGVGGHVGMLFEPSADISACPGRRTDSGVALLIRFADKLRMDFVVGVSKVVIEQDHVEWCFLEEADRARRIFGDP